MKRFSVLYILKDQHHHVGCTTHLEAKTILQNLLTDPKRTPIGIYDDKTELFEWEATRHSNSGQSVIEEQDRLGEQIITIAQALRRRDSSWHLAGEFQRPSFFA